MTKLAALSDWTAKIVSLRIISYIVAAKATVLDTVSPLKSKLVDVIFKNSGST
jgi:hypothetical protein